MAIQTPFRPIVGANITANDRRTAQMLKKLIRQGMNVSAAPTNTPYDTNEAAKMARRRLQYVTPLHPTDGFLRRESSIRLSVVQKRT